VQDRELRRDAANSCAALTLSSKARRNGRRRGKRGKSCENPHFSGGEDKKVPRLDTLVLLRVKMIQVVTLDKGHEILTL
jgi:hypothetical protein